MWSILYKGERQWEVWVVVYDSFVVIFRKYGKTNGKLTTTERKVFYGKNIGKTNETTVHEQACREAEAYWKKQQDTHHFSTNRSQEVPVVVLYSPMLAKTYERSADQKGPSITYPCVVQPKLDGVRLLVFMENGQLRMKSRSGKEMDNPNLHKIKIGCLAVLKKYPSLCCLDGELYSKHLSFEDTVSLCRSKSQTNLNGIEYHVYDIITNHSCTTRMTMLRNTIENPKQPDIYGVETRECKNEGDMLQMHAMYTSSSHMYEGVMLRTMNGMYESKRSEHLQKYKQFMDKEFKIVSVKEGAGRDENTAILECVNANQDTFWVRPVGTFNKRCQMLKDSSYLLGKYVTVVFQEYTKKGIPRFPVAKAIRDYE